MLEGSGAARKGQNDAPNAGVVTDMNPDHDQTTDLAPSHAHADLWYTYSADLNPRSGSVLVGTAIWVLNVWAMWRLFERSGRTGAWGLLAIIPVLLPAMVWYLAFATRLGRRADADDNT